MAEQKQPESMRERLINEIVRDYRSLVEQEIELDRKRERLSKLESGSFPDRPAAPPAPAPASPPACRVPHGGRRR
jgi:hypothetical protein